MRRGFRRSSNKSMWRAIRRLTPTRMIRVHMENITMTNGTTVEENLLQAATSSDYTITADGTNTPTIQRGSTLKRINLRFWVQNNNDTGNAFFRIMIVKNTSAGGLTPDASPTGYSGSTNSLEALNRRKMTIVKHMVLVPGDTIGSTAFREFRVYVGPRVCAKLGKFTDDDTLEIWAYQASSTDGAFNVIGKVFVQEA